MKTRLAVAALVALLLPGPHASALTVTEGNFIPAVAYYPGITTAGCTNNQQHDFIAAMYVVSNNYHPGPWYFSLYASSSMCETLATGAGSGYLTGDINGSVNYYRTYGVTTYTGWTTFGSTTITCTAPGWTQRNFNAVCTFQAS